MQYRYPQKNKYNLMYSYRTFIHKKKGGEKEITQIPFY